jgi:NodT family efflux transporter outer membrane factor (OMF) lipoprotein
LHRSTVAAIDGGTGWLARQMTGCGLRNEMRWGWAVALAALSGCTMGPDFHKPAPWWQPTSWFGGHPPITPASDRTSEPVPAPPDPDWWQVFHDPELTSLEQRVAGGNFDVRVATIRLAESRSQLGVTRADLFPQVNGNASYTRERQSAKGVLSLFPSSSGSPGTQSNGLGGTQGGIPNVGLDQPFDLYQYGFDASWELDLWGRVRRAVESARAQVDESAESRRDTLITALAEMARDYLELRGTQQVIAVIQNNLANQRRALALTQERAAAGLSTELDVANQQAQVQQTESQLPTLQAQAQVDINAIALLLGQPPESLDAELDTPGQLPAAPPTVPVGLPGELARRRPDIRRAEASLHAATAGVGVAVAAFYPTVTLSGSLAFQATQFRYLADWSSATYALGPSLTLPIFQGGRLTRTLELRKGQQQEAAVTYQQTVLGALHDVDNALTNYDAQQGQVAALARAVAQDQRAEGLARDQYTAGLEDFIRVLDVERQVLADQQQLVQARANVLIDLAQIYKALGGGWEDQYPEAMVAKPKPLIPVALVEP